LRPNTLQNKQEKKPALAGFFFGCQTSLTAAATEVTARLKRHPTRPPRLFNAGDIKM
jgi:hypothetical protein